jgi:hypothetical protein
LHVLPKKENDPIASLGQLFGPNGIAFQPVCDSKLALGTPPVCKHSYRAKLNMPFVAETKHAEKFSA